MRRQCSDVEIVLNDFDKRGGACPGLRTRVQIVKQRLDGQDVEFVLDTFFEQVMPCFMNASHVREV